MPSSWRYTAALAAVFFLLPPFCSAAGLPDAANIHFNLALKQYQARQLDEAQVSLGKSLAVNPNHPQSNLLSGIIACQQGRFADAIAPLKIATTKLPNNGDAFNNLGVAYFRTGRLDDAEEAFKKVELIVPGRADVALNRGVLALKRDKFDEAVLQFKAAAKVEPTNRQAWQGLGEAAEATGDKPLAMQARLRALELAPNDKALRLDLGQRLYLAGRITESAKILEPLQGQGEAPAEFIMGVLDYRRGDFASSRRRFETALAIKPDYPEARFNLAITFYDQGKYEEALGQFQEVLKTHPDDEEARKNLDITRQTAVRSSLKSGSEQFLKMDYKAALNSWNRALNLEPDNKVVRDLVDTAQAQLKIQTQELTAKGDAAWAAGKKEEAILAWTQILERDPENIGAKQGLDSAKDEAQRLAQAYRKSAENALSDGRWSQAQLYAERVASIDKIVGANLLEQVQKASSAKVAAEKANADAALKRGALHVQVESLQRAADAAPNDDSIQMALNLAKANRRQAVEKAVLDAEAMEKEGRVREASKFYRMALDMNPEHGAARAGYKRMNVRVASRIIDPAVVDDLYYQGVYAYAAGDTKKAEVFWKKVIDINPKHALALDALNRSQKRNKALKIN